MPQITKRSPGCQIVRTEYEIQRNSTNVAGIFFSVSKVRTSVTSGGRSRRGQLSYVRKRSHRSRNHRGPWRGRVFHSGESKLTPAAERRHSPALHRIPL